MTTEQDGTSGYSRRTFVRLAGSGAGLGIVGGTAAAGEYDDDTAQTIRLRGQVPGWLGESPLSITGRLNPTLELTLGEMYEVVWTNTDGAQHDFVIVDENGDPFDRTRTSSSQTPGATRETGPFEAKSSMSGYRCNFHPGTMTGDVETSK